MHVGHVEPHSVRRYDLPCLPRLLPDPREPAVSTALNRAAACECMPGVQGSHYDYDTLFLAKRQVASADNLQLKAAKIPPLDGLARSKGNPINRGHGAQNLYRHPPTGAMLVRKAIVHACSHKSRKMLLQCKGHTDQERHCACMHACRRDPTGVRNYNTSRYWHGGRLW